MKIEANKLRLSTPFYVTHISYEIYHHEAAQWMVDTHNNSVESKEQICKTIVFFFGL
jgi:hypothetical protein